MRFDEAMTDGGGLNGGTDRSSGRGAIGLVALRTWQRTWRQCVLLAVAVALTLGVVLALLLGAARSVTAMDRLREETRSSDLLLGGGDAVEGLLETVAAEPGVVEAGGGRELFVLPKGSDLFPSYNLRSFAPYPLPGGAPVDVPVIVEGRAPDQARADEVLMNRALADELGLRVGDRVVLASESFEWVEAAYSGQDPGPPDGPEVEATLVGLALAPVDFTRTENVMYLTAAYADRYQDQVRTYEFVNAVLTKARFAQVEAERTFAAGTEDAIDVQAFPNNRSEGVQDSLETIAAALRLVAATVGLAALATISLLTVRLAREVAADRATLIAIGWTGSEVMALASLVLVPALTVGVVVGLVLGVGASPSTSVGLAAAVDPARRAVVLDPAMVAGVGLVTTAVMAALVGVAALRASRPANSARATTPPAPPLERPLSIALGVRRALFGASDRGGRLSRSAVVAVAAGATIAVAALIVGASIDRLQVDPFLSGQGPANQRAVDGGEGAEGLAVADRAIATLEADERVVDLAAVHVAFDVSGPSGDLPVLVYDARRGDSGAALTSGRFPTQSDEIAIGPASLEAMGLEVGDDIELRHPRGRAQFTIVGAVLLPEGDFNHDSGVVLATAGARFLGGIDGTEIHQVVFSWGPQVDGPAADDALTAAGFNVLTPEGRLVPASVSSLGDVRSLAAWVAVVVLVLGLVTALYAVTATGRLRRHEAGTLRALGLTPRALATTTEVQGLGIALVGVVIGLPVGVAVGRQLWSLIAARAHVVDVPVVGAASLAWVAGATLVSVAILSLPLAFRDARRPPADALRVE